MMVDGKVSHLRRITGIALVSVPIGHDTASDALFNTQYQHILISLPVSVELFHQCRALDIMIQEHRNSIALLYRLCHIQILYSVKITWIDNPALLHIYRSRRRYSDGNDLFFPLQQAIQQTVGDLHDFLSARPFPFYPFVGNDIHVQITDRRLQAAASKQNSYVFRSFRTNLQLYRCSSQLCLRRHCGFS